MGSISFEKDLCQPNLRSKRLQKDLQDTGIRPRRFQHLYSQTIIATMSAISRHRPPLGPQRRRTQLQGGDCQRLQFVPDDAGPSQLQRGDQDCVV